ncbi:response regulator transcription factor [Curvibacter sp. CHRR-16]|uniref:response regulator transcription factor n=1 Tax=Curvibacter sp. CHRR-16 TaxID=2835872 RepID=UPI001BDB1CCA|nr:response regulator transcription factor [Curvibacter sp. CHRR-16]MBT0569897.1 response regulator transcription factor [Curvibacter sp. CHRR-16]
MQRVLLLEDHPRLSALIKRVLAQSGIECDCVDSIEAAWVALVEQDYSAALIDRGLPDGDGVDLLRRLRSRGNHLPCLLLTARDALHDRIEGLESGADDYLCKPFPMVELLARTRALLRRPPAQIHMAPHYGDIQLHPDQLQMVCAEKSVNLPRGELQIMLSLVKAGGQPVRRSALEAAAWGQMEAVTPNALDVALHRLRRKLESIGSSVEIVNLRSIGYALHT